MVFPVVIYSESWTERKLSAEELILIPGVSWQLVLWAVEVFGIQTLIHRVLLECLQRPNSAVCGQRTDRPWAASRGKLGLVAAHPPLVGSSRNFSGLTFLAMSQH